MNKFVALLFTLVFCSFAFGQKSKKEERREKRKAHITELVKQEEEGVIVNKKHFLGGVKLHTDGYGFFVEKGKAQSIRKSLLFQIEITERKHPKEDRQLYPTGANFIYGKTNFFYPVKLGVQQQYLLGNKGNKNGVSISANAGGGISLGLLRPYLLGFASANGSELEYKSFADDSVRFISGSNLTGPNFGTGFSKMKLAPGGYLKAGVRFDYGPYNEVVSALEVGIISEFYGKKISQMAFSTDKNFFFSAYIAIIVGKRK
jgi:hypothetical protein